jgi:hypothetical protein
MIFIASLHLLQGIDVNNFVSNALFQPLCL